MPALAHLAGVLRERAAGLQGVVKTGRTHLMDAMPIRLGQEVGAWATQVEQDIARIRDTLPRCESLDQGGTAVGTGVNAHPEFAVRFARRLSDVTGVPFLPSEDLPASLASQDAAVETSGQLRVTSIDGRPFRILSAYGKAPVYGDGFDPARAWQAAAF